MKNLPIRIKIKLIKDALLEQQKELEKPCSNPLYREYQEGRISGLKTALLFLSNEKPESVEG